VHEELDGVLVARRGRLVERIDDWDAATARELARWCAQRARDLAAKRAEDPRLRALAEDIAFNAEGSDRSGTGLAMYGTAHAFELAAAGGYQDERRRQADWLRERLGLGRVQSPGAG
jgi:hypothetical protein